LEPEPIGFKFVCALELQEAYGHERLRTLGICMRPSRHKRNAGHIHYLRPRPVSQRNMANRVGKHADELGFVLSRNKSTGGYENVAAG
jgi:hypothetical protein